MRSVFWSLLIISIWITGCNHQAEKSNDQEVQAHPQTPSNQPISLNLGIKVYKQNCKVCHGADGTLSIGGAADLSGSRLPLDSVISIIQTGKKAMVGYKHMLSPAEIESVAQYIVTFRK